MTKEDMILNTLEDIKTQLQAAHAERVEMKIDHAKLAEKVDNLIKTIHEKESRWKTFTTWILAVIAIVSSILIAIFK